MHQIVVGWGFAPDPTGGAHSAPPGPLAGFRGWGPGGREGGGEGKTREGRGGRRGERKGRDGRVGEGRRGLTVVFGGLQLSSAGTEGCHQTHAITSSNLNRFSKLFYQWKSRKFSIKLMYYFSPYHTLSMLPHYLLEFIFKFVANLEENACKQKCL